MDPSRCTAPKDCDGSTLVWADVDAPGSETLAYYEILEFNNKSSAIVVYDSQFGSYYSYSGDSWIGYDDVESVTLKIRFARSWGLGGYFFWALGLDKDWIISRKGATYTTLC